MQRILAALIFFCVQASAEDTAQKPNIIVILADDLGYGELGCYGGKDAPTPHLDAMAREGVRFTAGYVTCPVCSPSRAALLVGKYQERFGHENNIGQSWELEHGELMGLPLEEKTLADRLKAAGAVNYSLNTPLHGFKGQCYEGGIRIPFMAAWPGKITPGVTSDAAVSALDILPTALAAAGAAPSEKTDGVSLLPLLTGASSAAPHEKLFWRFVSYKAVRKGALKLIKQRNQPDELYDLAADLRETKNLADEKPDAVVELNKELAAWESEMIAPRWNQKFPLRPDGRAMFPHEAKK